MVGNYFGSGVWHYLELETSHHWIIYTERSVDNPVPQHPAKILVVDDDPEVCEAIAAVLAEELTDAIVPIPSHRWQKIVEEIIDNAFRYSVAGQRVWVKSWFKDNFFLFQVQDCGRGMTPYQISNLGAYMQFDRRLYEQQGTGLGLTVAKRLVEFYGGTLTIDSTPLVGTTVTLEFQVIPE